MEEAITKAETLGFARFISDEADAAAEIKKEKPIMVVLGNPPYSVSSANRGDWIERLIQDYKEGLQEKKTSLDDDYIKFIRFAQWRIDRTGLGVVGIVSNNSYLRGLTHRRMRESLLTSFDSLYVVNLRGDARVGDVAPDGSPDENVFDIMQGVAIAVLVREEREHEHTGEVVYRDEWGRRQAKYRALVQSHVGTSAFEELDPHEPHFFFVPTPRDGLSEYRAGWKLTDVFLTSGNGIKTDRDSFCFDLERERLLDRVRRFFRGDYDESFRERYRLYASSSYDIEGKRDALPFDAASIQPCLYRPFDKRWLYYQPGFTSRPAQRVMRHMQHENLALLGCRQQARTGFRHVFCCNGLAECCTVSLKTREITSAFPLYLYVTTDAGDPSLFARERTSRDPNLSGDFIEEVADKLVLDFIPDGKGDLEGTFGPEDVFHYMYAVFHSPTYRERYAEFLKIDFPRLPLTSDLGLFRALAEKGGELVALHLMESSTLDHLITTFPITGSNEVEKVRYAEAGRVYINKAQYFEGVEKEVWEFHIGGYQVLHKWLKDRKGRTLSYDDVTHYGKIVVALKETMRLMEEIDEIIPSWPID